jgi:predicted TIM-barrel fold metal-dependent hydrolase
MDARAAAIELMNYERALQEIERNAERLGADSVEVLDRHIGAITWEFQWARIIEAIDLEEAKKLVLQTGSDHFSYTDAVNLVTELERIASAFPKPNVEGN